MNSILRLIVCVLLTLGINDSLPAQSGKPNMLLFLSDDLTYHDIGCYGNEEVRTPTIDQMAKMVCASNTVSIRLPCAPQPA